MKKLINLVTLAVLVSVNALTPFSYAMTALPDNPLNEGTVEYNRKGGYIQLTYNDKKIRIRDKNVGATKVAVNDYIPLYNLGREYYDNFGYNPCGIVPTKGSVPSEEYYETEFLARAQELLGLSEPLTCDDVEEIEMLYNSGTYNSYENSAYIASFGNYYFRGNNTGAKREDLNVNLDNMEVNINPEIIEKGFDGGKIGEKDTGWEKGEMNNPCDANNGEYLPTPDDWKDLMQYRGWIKGYELIHDHSGGEDVYEFGEEEAMAKFVQDMRMPNAGGIKLGDATFLTGRGLWAAGDGARIGVLSLYDGIGVLSMQNIKDIFNTVAMPVRCFVYIDPVTVNFYSGNDTLKTIKLEKGETVDELEMPARDGYIYKWNTASGEEWNFSKPLASDTDLYLEWQECEEGYEIVKNQCVAEGSAGVKHKNGLIKISDGKDTIYIKDRNQGNIDDETLDDYKFLLSAEVVLGGLFYDEIGEQCDYDEECVNEKALEYIEEKTGKHFDSEEEVEEYGRNMLEKYGDGNDGLVGLLKKMVGNFYFRGNNTGVSWDELVIEDGKIMNKSELVQKGFDGGKFGNIDGSGWIEGNYNNPCDWSKGEYLPTPNDWENLLGVWSNIYGYEVNDNLGNMIPIEGFDDEIEIVSFMLDTLMMIPLVPSIISISDLGDEMLVQGQNEVIELRNGQSKSGEIGTTATMLSDMFLGVAHFNPENMPEEMLSGINSGAMPVRCFVKVPVVKFETKGGSPMNDMEVFKGEKLVIKKQPTKSNATFDGWYKDAGLTEKWDIDNDVVEDDMTLYAKWIENKPSGGSSSGGGGGGSNNTSNDDKINTDKDNIDKDNSEKAVDDNQSVNDDNSQNEDNNSEKGSNKITQGQSNPEKSEYSDEFQQAYQFSKRNGITTMSTIQRAKMNSPLTRIAMAKMLSQYAINVLGKMPDISKGTIKFNDVTNKMDKNYDNGVTLAYQLGIMGQNMPNNNFRPNDEVTRAEFVAAFSRMLYGTLDGEYKSTSKYYIHHMEKLKSEGIVTNTNPSMKERRGYVMIMLMRSAK